VGRGPADHPAPGASAWRARALSLAVLALLTIAGVWANGYAVGLDDHAIHLVFLERARDAAFLRGDLLADAAPHHASLFWILQAPLVDAIGVEALYAIVHALSWLAMFAGLAALAQALAPQLDRRHVAWLACVPAVLAPLTFGSIPSFDALMLNRTVVLGGELFALGMAVRGRGVVSLGLIGLLANIHATTALHAAALAGVLLLFHHDRWRQLLRGGVACAVAAAPLAIMLSVGRAPAPSSTALAYGEWRNAVETHYPFHHFLAWWTLNDAAALLMPTVAILAAYRHTRERAWLILLGTAYALGCANAIATELLHLRLGTVLHLYETGRLLAFVGFAAAATTYLATRDATPRHRRAGLLLPIIVMGHAMWSPLWKDQWNLRWSALAIIAGAALLLPERAKTRRTAMPWLASISLLIAIGAATYAHDLRGVTIDPSIDSAAKSETACRWETVMALEGVPRRDLCGLTMMAWAKRNLPATAVVATAPYFGHPIAGFRFRAGRRVVATFKDGGEATFDDRVAASWLERFDALGGTARPGPTHDADGLWMETIYPAIEAFHAARQFRFEQLQARYGVTHVVCQVGFCAHLTWPVVYADRAFTIREAPRASATPRVVPP
jgi:hypothetical protein